MNRKILAGLALAAFVAFLVLPVLLPFSAHAQTTTWSVASTTVLGQNAESNGAGNAYAMILLIVPITLGLAAFFFALRWIWHRVSGKH